MSALTHKGYTAGPVEYDPVSASEESVGIYFHADGTNHKLIGARGTCTLEFPRNGVPLLNFTFTGLWTAPAAAALPTVTLSGVQKPLTVSKANVTPSS